MELQIWYVKVVTLIWSWHYNKNSDSQFFCVLKEFIYILKLLHTNYHI